MGGDNYQTGAGTIGTFFIGLLAVLAIVLTVMVLVVAAIDVAIGL